MILAREKAEEVCCAEILNKSSIVNILLPLVLSHISPLATIDSRVSFACVMITEKEKSFIVLRRDHSNLKYFQSLNLNAVPELVHNPQVFSSDEKP